MGNHSGWEYVSVYLSLGISTELNPNTVYFSVQKGENVSLIKMLKVTMTCLLLALIIGLVMYVSIIKVAMTRM